MAEQTRQLKNYSLRGGVVTPFFSLLCCLLISLAASSEEITEIDPRVTESRLAIKAFGGQLVRELKQALKEGGPVKAIKVCNIEALQIADALSEQHHWQIGRTSLKTRHPNNNPDAWERMVLQQFEQRKQKGEDLAKLEYFEETEKGFRYMKAIPTKGLCLACHGENLAEPVQAALAERYSEDRATGFKLGDIRGAFTITQP